MSRIREYYQLTKPGIIYSNALTIAAGFFLAAKSGVNWLLLVETIVGVGLVAAASCVVNNYLDRDIDKKMERTSGRALARGRVSPTAALTFAGILLALGAAVLIIFTNRIALFVALAGFCIYIFIYTPAKRRTMYATHIGALAGAAPPLAGYAAARPALDQGALAVLLILVFWQLAHFFSIAIYRKEDYAAAGVPTWPVRRGVSDTKIQILLYVGAFAVAAGLPYFIGIARGLYLIGALALSACWLAFAVSGFFIADSKRWARSMFFFSLAVIVGLCLAVFADHFLPFLLGQ